MKPAIDPSRCKKTVWGKRGWSNQCTRKPVKDGYCKIHHPDTVAAKEKAWREKYDAKRKWDKWRDIRSSLRSAIADAAIEHRPIAVEELVRRYEEHLKQEPPKPE